LPVLGVALGRCAGELKIHVLIASAATANTVKILNNIGVGP